MGKEVHAMESITQKKFSITTGQSRFLEQYREWGYSDQSSIVRDALTRFISDSLRNQRKIKMKKKSIELRGIYEADRELTAFSVLDGDDFL